MSRTENPRAEFAYRCAFQILSLEPFSFHEKSIPTHHVLISGLEARIKEKFKKDNLFQEIHLILYLVNREKFYSQKNFTAEQQKQLNDFLQEQQTKLAKNYKSYVKKMPMLIKNNGLAATYAFIYSKQSKELAYELIYQQTKEWLIIHSPAFIDFTNQELMLAIISLNTPEYRAITREVQTFMSWVSRFATGLIEGDEEDG